MHGVDGIQNAFAADMTQAATNCADRVAVERLGHIGLELAQDLRDSNGNPWPPVGNGSRPPHSDRRSFFDQDQSNPQATEMQGFTLKLMPFMNVPFVFRRLTGRFAKPSYF